MKTKPRPHVWRLVPSHGGPDSHRCTFCGLHVWEDDDHPAYCAPSVEKITPHPLPVASRDGFSFSADLITPTLHD